MLIRIRLFLSKHRESAENSQISVNTLMTIGCEPDKCWSRFGYVTVFAGDIRLITSPKKSVMCAKVLNSTLNSLNL